MKKKIEIFKFSHNPVRVGDNVIVDVKTKTRKPKPTNTSSSKKPRKSLDERITEALAKALKPVMSRLDNIENTLKRNSLR